MSEAGRRWWPALLWAAGIFIVSSRSKLPEMPRGLLSWDKLHHFAAYAVGGAALAYALRARPGRPSPWAAVALGSLYGVSDEVHQLFVPGRNSDWHDWVADTVGVLAGIFLYRTYLTWQGRRAAAVPEP